MTNYVIGKDTAIDANGLEEFDGIEFSSLITEPITLTVTGTGSALVAFTIMGNHQQNTIIFNTGGTSLANVQLMLIEEGSTVIVNGTGASEDLGQGPNSAGLVPVQLRGLGGNDTMIGRVAGDRLFGGSQDDTLIVQGVGIRAFGGTGTDVLQADFSADLDTRVTMDLSDGGGGRVVQAGTRVSEMEAFRGKLSSQSDTFIGGIGRDEVNGWFGKDTLNGGEGTDILTGGSDADVMDGGAGRDVLIGESGADVLTGGLGADRFVFAGGDSGFGAQRDQVTDFEQGRDKIDLIRMAGFPGNPGYDPFTFIGETLYLPGYGTQVGFEVVGATTVIQFYDDERLMGEIVLQGVFDLKATDFIL